MCVVVAISNSRHRSQSQTHRGRKKLKITWHGEQRFLHQSIKCQRKDTIVFIGKWLPVDITNHKWTQQPLSGIQLYIRCIYCLYLTVSEALPAIAACAKQCAENHDGLSLVFHYQSAFEKQQRKYPAAGFAKFKLRFALVWQQTWTRNCSQQIRFYTFIHAKCTKTCFSENIFSGWTVSSD